MSDYNIEQVEQFAYILTILKSRLIHGNMIWLIYKVLLQPVLLYRNRECEAEHIRTKFRVANNIKNIKKNNMQLKDLNILTR